MVILITYFYNKMGSKPSLCSGCKEPIISKKKKDKNLCLYCKHFYIMFNKGTLMLENYSNGVSPLNKNYEKYSTAFLGDIYKYTPNNIIILTSIRSEGCNTVFWEPTSVNIDRDCIASIPLRQNFKNVNILAVPRGVLILVGISSGNNNFLLTKGQLQVYVPKRVIEALYPMSQAFLSERMNYNSQTNFIRDAYFAIKQVQDIWWQQYKVQTLVQEKFI
jgi:hypothetical protein